MGKKRKGKGKTKEGLGTDRQDNGRKAERRETIQKEQERRKRYT